MHKRLLATAAGVSLISGLFAASNTAHAAIRTVPSPNQCIATISSPITAGASAQEVSVSISEELMDSVTAEIAPESHIRIASVTRDMGQNVLKLQVDASNGAPGTWALTLRGQNTFCQGQLKVSPKS